MKTTLRLRLGNHEAHYAGNLVDGARCLQLFGDAATELLIRHDGDEGLFRAYSQVEFIAPVYAGDFIEITAQLIGTGQTSRTIHFEAHVMARSATAPGLAASAADILDPPILVCRAEGTCVVQSSLQRIHHD